MTDSTVETELVRLGELLAKATPELTNGSASVKAVESLLRAGWAGQRPRAKQEPHYAEDAALIVAAVNALPRLLPYIATLQARIAEAEGGGRQAGMEDAARVADRAKRSCGSDEAYIVQGIADAIHAAAKFLAPKGDGG